MRSFCKDNIIQNLITAISIIFLAIILNSCENDSANKSLPKPSTAMALSITQTGANLTGMVYLEGNSTTAKYEYGTSLSYGNFTGSSTSSGGVYQSWPVFKTVAGLNPGITYHYRLVATNKNGTASGSDRTFTTLD